MKKYLSIGLMSGTSMDGVDAAILETTGDFELIKPIGQYFLPYNQHEKVLFKALEYSVNFANGDLDVADLSFKKCLIDYLINKLDLPQDLSMIEIEKFNLDFDMSPAKQIIDISTRLHAKAVMNLLDKYNIEKSKIDVIGYHGQTLYHKPQQKKSVIVGDGKLLSKLTGIAVVDNFRANDIAHGGEGAPLAPIYHQALAIRDNIYPIAIVNCGGIANVSVITGTTVEDLIGFDTGPGNGLIDSFVKYKTHGQQFYDVDGNYGLLGQVREDILELLFAKAVVKSGRNFFDIKAPKSLDINDLILPDEVLGLSIEDGCKTLAVFTAKSIVRSLLDNNIDLPINWGLAGGGWNNPNILTALEAELNLHIDPVLKQVDDLGWHNAELEAEIFSFLAVRSIKGLPLSFPKTTGVMEPVIGGEFIN